VGLGPSEVGVGVVDGVVVDGGVVVGLVVVGVVLEGGGAVVEGAFEDSEVV
jgi:hypothetical protein